MHAPTHLPLVCVYHFISNRNVSRATRCQSCTGDHQRSVLQPLVSSTRELYEANVAIAEALLSLSRSSDHNGDQVEAQVGGIVSSEHAHLANLQTQPHATPEVGTAQDETLSRFEVSLALTCGCNSPWVR
jgi:hypothetical protein